jgi:Formate hydrogenlyase subunit 3/Multisubunit Na+/H+ antiporter, MnhD subunit
MPSLFIVIPLMGIIILNLANRRDSSKTGFFAAAAILLLQIIMSCTMGSPLWSRIEAISKANHIAVLSANSYSSLMLFTIGLVALISLSLGMYSQNINLFNFSNLVLLVVMGMDGVVLVNDLFSLYVFLEITAVSTFILISIQKKGNALEGSFKYLIMSALATVFILLAIALIFMMVGSLKFDVIGKYFEGLGGTMPIPALASAVLLLSGLLIKGGLIPFHGWLPDAYSSAPPAVSILVAGIETKIAGVYSMLIVYTSVLNKNPLVGAILIIFGIVSVVLGALNAIGQDDFKTMLAFSSISQIGYIIIGIGIGTPLSLMGAVFHFFNHAVFKSLLFVNSGAVEMQTGTRDFGKLGGLASKMPYTGVTSIIGFLSTAGIPPFSGFWSKFIIIAAAWQSKYYAIAAAALLSSILTICYFLKLQKEIFFGEPKEGLEGISEANAGFKYASVILSAITVIAGVLFPFVAKVF